MGNGILLATDNVYAQLTNVATGQTITAACKLFYRIYSASVTEYVGIVRDCNCRIARPRIGKR
jgi:hypothetical protein